MNKSINQITYLKFPLLLISLTLVNVSKGQERNLAEKLGYEKDTKLLIMHADDIGVAYSENKASIEALEKGGINSASIMVPCPWFKDIATYIKDNPGFDFGLHLTLNAEWENYKWDGVLPASEIPSLLNEEGYFYATSEEVAANARPEEVEAELRAQVQRAIDFGIQPTHLDSHMFTLFYHPEFYKSYQKIGKEFNIPVFLPMNFTDGYPEAFKQIDPFFITVNNAYIAPPEIAADEWNNYYNDIINNLQPGLNVILVHLAYDDDEMKAVCINKPDWGAAWRQRDLDYVLSEEFQNVLKQNNIQLVTYKEIQQLMNKSQ